MYRVILSPDGKSVVPQSNPPLSLIGKKGLGVAQAPDGSLVQVQYSVNEVWVFIPSEAASSNVRVNAVWPRRGPQAGGSTLTVYGRNLKQTGKTTTVKVGNSNCPLTSSTATEIKCTLPGGTPGSTDVVVTVGTESYTFSKGYRFITGKPQPPETKGFRQASTSGRPAKPPLINPRSRPASADPDPRQPVPPHRPFSGKPPAA